MYEARNGESVALSVELNNHTVTGRVTIIGKQLHQGLWRVNAETQSWLWPPSTVKTTLPTFCLVST